MKKFIFCIIFILSGLCTLAAYCSSTPVSLKTTVDKNKVFVGERFNYRIIVYYPKAARVEIPDFKDTIGNFSIKKISVKKGGYFNENKITATYTLNSFVVGKHEIGPLSVKYSVFGVEGTVKTKALLAEVKDIVIEDAHTIKPIAGPVGFIHRYKLALIIAGSIISFLILFFVFSLTVKIIKNRPKPVVYPHEKALQALDGLNLAFSQRAADAKQYFIKIADILRDYIEERYELKASKMTTEQFAKKIATIGEISQPNKDLIMNLLKRKDAAQFAQGAILQDELEPAIAFVKKFIESTKKEG